MVFFVNEFKKLIPIEVEDENVYKNKENFIVTNELPEALFPYYKLNENNQIVPDEELIFEKTKKMKISEIKSAFEFYIKNGYKCSNGIVMDADFQDIQKLESGYKLAIELGMEEMIVGDYYDKDHILKTEEVKKMLTELGINYSTLWSKKVKLRKQIFNANTLEEVLAISWEEN